MWLAKCPQHACRPRARCVDRFAKPRGFRTSKVAKPRPPVSTAPHLSAPSNGNSPRRHFFVKFLARSAASYGHMYVMYGEVNACHEVIRSEIAGLVPSGNTRDYANCSVYNWTIGNVIPVTSEIGASDGDLEEQYVLARYRVWIDAAEYKRLIAYIDRRKATKGSWHALFNNCVTFGHDVAAFLNLNVPRYFHEVSCPTRKRR